MKKSQTLITGLVLSAVALALVSTAVAQTIEGSATVIRIKGPARYTTGNNTWQPLKTGMVLKAGTVVQTSTEKGSFVDLVLGDGGAAAVATPLIYRPNIPSSYSSSMSYQPSSEQNVIRLWENSALGIDKLTTVHTGADVVTDTQLDLKVGHISGNVKKMSAASKYEIKLPNGVAGIRGTVYDVSAEGVVRVFVGSVVLAWVDSKGNVVTQVVSGGQQYDARTGELTPISQADMHFFDQISMSMHYLQPTSPTVFTADKTVVHVSPVGPPFHPPGPPPNIPPGRGEGP